MWKRPANMPAGRFFIFFSVGQFWGVRFGLSEYLFHSVSFWLPRQDKPPLRWWRNADGIKPIRNRSSVFINVAPPMGGKKREKGSGNRLVLKERNRPNKKKTIKVEKNKKWKKVGKIAAERLWLIWFEWIKKEEKPSVGWKKWRHVRSKFGGMKWKRRTSQVCWCYGNRRRRRRHGPGPVMKRRVGGRERGGIG